MTRPEVKLMAVSNVYCRMMIFKQVGDQEVGHYHTYDHGTLLANGKLLVEIIEKDGSVSSQKEFVAPTFVFVAKNKIHRLTAMEDNTIAGCIHALRTIDEELVDSEFLVSHTDLAQNENGETKNINELMRDKGMIMKPLCDHSK